MSDDYPLVTPDDGLNAPGCCALTGDIDGPFVDLKRWIPYADPYAYIHEPFCHEIGRAVGMVEASEHEALKTEVRERTELLAEMMAELEDLREKVAAFQSVKEMMAV